MTQNLMMVCEAKLVLENAGNAEPTGNIEAVVTTWGPREGADGRKFNYQPEAFMQWAESFSKAGRPLPMFVNHDADSIPVGEWTSFEFDDKGMKACGRLYLNTTQGSDLYQVMSESPNMFGGVSVGAYAEEYQWTKEDGSYLDAVKDKSVGVRDKNKAKQVSKLLNNPNNFQSKYEFWYQWLMWLELSGEAFTLWWREDQKNPSQTPMEMYVLDSTLIAVTINPARYPSYRLSTPSYGFSKDEPLAAHQVMHIKEAAWQGSAGFNKGILAAELVTLDQDIDVYANFIMLNGAKPTGMFTTEQVIPDGKYKELASRLKEAW